MNQTICLNMIVKNEAPIIRDTLENILSYIPITSYMISDTGSTDNTVDVILQFFQERGIPGQIRLDHWQNFAYNRNLALMEATGKSDYVFFFDADDRFVGNLQLPEVLTADSYNFQFSNQAQTTTYQRPLLVRNNGTFRWRSVVHEYIDSDEPILSDFISGDYNVISGRFVQEVRIQINISKMLKCSLKLTTITLKKTKNYYLVMLSMLQIPIAMLICPS